MSSARSGPPTLPESSSIEARRLPPQLEVTRETLVTREFSSLARAGGRKWVHLIFADLSVGAKHSGIKMMAEDDKFSPRMLRPCQSEMHPAQVHVARPFRVGVAGLERWGWGGG